MFRKLTITISLAILLISLLAIGVFSPSRSRAARPFSIGLILPLTGSLADYGMAIQNSIELAKRDRPELFANIKLVYEDVQYDTKQAVAAFHKLRTVNKVDLTYVFGVSFCKAIAPLAEAVRLPLVGQCIDPSTGAGRSYVVRFMNYTDEYLRVQTAYLARHGLNKIGVLLSDNAYLEEMYAALQRNLLPGQHVEIIERLPAGDMDLRSAIAKAKSEDFDVIGVLLATGQIPQYYRQARELAFKRPSFGTNWFESLSEVKAAAGAMDGSVFANNMVKPDFVKRYRKIFGNEGQLAFGAPAYEFALVVGELFAGKTTPPTSTEIISAFSGVPLRQGTAAGPYLYREDPNVGKYFQFPLVIKEVAGDEFMVVE